VLEAAHFLFPKFFHKAFDLASGGGEVNIDGDGRRKSGKVDSAGSEQDNAVVAGMKSAYLQQLNRWRKGTTSEAKKLSESVELYPQGNK